jgi:hypothetical protein
MKTFLKVAAVLAVAVGLGALMGAGVTGEFTQVNSVNGYLVNGAVGSTGIALCSNGSYYGAGCVIPVAPVRTCNSNGCYQILANGTIEEWIFTGALLNNSPTNVTLAYTMTQIMDINCTDNSSRVSSGGNQPVGANVAGLGSPFTYIVVDTPASGMTAYCYVAGY